MMAKTFVRQPLFLHCRGRHVGDPLGIRRRAPRAGKFHIFQTGSPRASPYNKITRFLLQTTNSALQTIKQKNLSGPLGHLPYKGRLYEPLATNYLFFILFLEFGQAVF